MSEIKISAGFEREKIWKRGDSVRYLVVEVEAIEQEARSNNSSVNIGLVIDASGSMAGQWIESAKSAAIGIIEGLTSADTVSVVSFASEARIHCSGLAGTPIGKQQAIQKISMLSSRDTTNLSSGWLTGAECVAGVMAASNSSPISNVIVLSDGHANRGITDPGVLATHASELLKRGITSSAVGIGTAYSNLQLQAIAGNGGGLVHHASRPAEIVEVVVGELGELREVVAESIELEISSNRLVDIECYSPFVRLEKSNIAGRNENLAFKSPSVARSLQSRALSSLEEKTDHHLLDTFSLGSLTAGASRSVALKVNTPAVGESASIDFAIRCGWKEPSNQAVRQYVNTETSLYFSDGRANSLQHVDQDKARVAALAWLAKSVREAIEFNEEGRYQDASDLMRVQGAYFKRFCGLIDGGESLMVEWDRAVPHMAQRIDPFMAKETTQHFYTRSRGIVDRRKAGYSAWSPVK